MVTPPRGTSPAEPGRAIDTRALVVWLAGSLVIVISLGNPFSALVATAASACVAALAGDRRPYRLFLIAGFAAFVLRTVLFVLLGHQGDDVLFRLPEVRLPPPLGGLVFGGPVVGEVVAHSVAEGLQLWAVMALFGAFACLAGTVDLIRLVPRALFDAGLVVAIGMTMAPGMTRAARDIREAQAMRGGKARMTDLPSVFMPLLATALDRSITLAEAMDSRGYGRNLGESAGHTTWRAALIVSALWTSATVSLWAAGVAPGIMAPAGAAGAVGIVTCLRALSRLSPRSVYRPRRWRSVDKAVGAVSAAGAVAALSLSGQTGRAGALVPVPALLLAALIALPAALSALSSGESDHDPASRPEQRPGSWAPPRLSDGARNPGGGPGGP